MSATQSETAYGTNYAGTAAENYERYFVPVIGTPLALDLIATAALHPGERVLDVACGTGVIARLAAKQVEPGGTVSGLDINAGMLAVARALAPAIRWYETSAEAMPLPDASFDVVLSQLGLQFIADRNAALREMRRVLAPGGRVLVTVPTPTQFFDQLEQALTRNVPAAAGFVSRVFSLNDRKELESLLRRAGFGDVVVRHESRTLQLPAPADFLWQYIHSTPLGGMVPSRESPLGESLERVVETAWQPWVHDGGMQYEQGMLVATAR